MIGSGVFEPRVTADPLSIGTRRSWREMSSDEAPPPAGNIACAKLAPGEQIPKKKSMRAKGFIEYER
jgi:hypothetical protein